MFFEDKRQIGIFVLANIAAICANGQSYAERGNLPTGIAVQTDDEADLMHTEYYDWSQIDDDDDSKVWRWNVEEFPHPKLNPRYCNRMAPSNLCDPDSILIRDEANRLDTVITKLYNNTPCICDTCGPNAQGIQVGIALLRNTFQPYIEHQSKVIRSFAENLRSKWRLGPCENDILIVLATDDRQSYTDVGCEAAKYISKDEAYKIFIKSRPHFSKGEYYEGLLAMLKAFQNATKEISTRKDDPEMGIALISGIIVVIVIVVGILIIVGVILYRRRIDKTGSRESKHQRSGPRISSWHPKKIKALFSSCTSSYEPCDTQEKKQNDSDTQIEIKDHNVEDDEILNLDLAKPDPKPVGENHLHIDTVDTSPKESSTTSDSNPKESPATSDSNPKESSATTDSNPKESSATTDSNPKESSTTTDSNPKESPGTTDSNREELPIQYESEGHDEVDGTNSDPQTSDPSASTSTPQKSHQDVIVEQHLPPIIKPPPTFTTFMPKSHIRETLQSDL